VGKQLGKKEGHRQLLVAFSALVTSVLVPRAVCVPVRLEGFVPIDNGWLTFFHFLALLGRL
jgi:hypothetical protein